MQDNAYDHLIIGSTPLAGLVAGLLKREHGRRVCLVAEPYSVFGLERRFDLSADLITRPETLVLLKQLTVETLKLIGGFSKSAVDKTDALFIGEGRATSDALSHFMHLAQALDYPAERVVDRTIAEGTIIRLRGQNLIAYHRFAPSLAAWLDDGEVRRVDKLNTTVALQKDGTARISTEGHTVEAAQVLLADDDAVITHLPADSWDKSVVKRPATALLLQPAAPAANPFTVWFDRGVAMRQEHRGPLAAVATGDRDSAEARIAASSAKMLPLRRAGESRFDALATLDGAPLYTTNGRASRTNYLAGFGLAAAFYAPAIARQLVDRSSKDEIAWFAARGATTRANPRLDVAELA